jgi:hypothetical protein
MNIATLRVKGPDEALDQISQMLELSIDARWTAGHLDRRGAVILASTLNANIADAENRIELEAAVRSFLDRCRSGRISFKSLSLSAQLDIGLGVGLHDQFTAGVEFASHDLLAFSEIGLDLRISAYPCSDENEEATGDT